MCVISCETVLAVLCRHERNAIISIVVHHKLSIHMSFRQSVSQSSVTRANGGQGDFVTCHLCGGGEQTCRHQGDWRVDGGRDAKHEEQNRRD